MTSGLGSITVSGLLGGTAGKIDTDALVKSLMQAESIPQNQLKDQLAAQQKVTGAYQSLNSRLAALTDAARAVTDTDSWKVTTATSSNPGVVATSTTGALVGASTFHVAQLASAQVSTVAADGAGNVVSNPAAGLDLTVGSTAHHIDLTSGSAADVASAINSAGIGVRAAVIDTDGGPVLQLASASTGADNAFTATGFDSPAQTIVNAKNAQITVGNPGSGGYTISSASNTFHDAMPGVTFSVSADALGKDVTISVSDDVDAITAMVQKMVDSANAAKLAISQATGKGGLLQGYSDVRTISMDLGSAISMGTTDGKSLTDFGVDMDRNGVISFDAAAFTAAYAADAKGTMDAISGSLGASFLKTADAASAPITGTISQAITQQNSHTDDLNTQIDNWNDRLDKIHTRLTLKYAAMQTALAKLQSQGDWLTSMFKSMQNGNKDN